MSHPRMRTNLIQTQPIRRIQPKHPLHQIQRIRRQSHPPLRQYLHQIARGHELEVLTSHFWLFPWWLAREHYKENDTHRPEVDYRSIEGLFAFAYFGW